MNRNVRYFASYLSTVKNLQNKTIDAYVSDLNLLENYLISHNLTFLSATNKDITNYLANENLKPKSYNRKITSFIEFYKYLYSEHENYNVNIEKLHHIKNEKIYPQIISFDDLKKMIATEDNTTIGKRNKVIIMLLYITGLRVSELINLTYNDINMNEGYIRCIGKGNKEKIIQVGDLLKITLGEYNDITRKEILNGLVSNYVFVNTEAEPLSRQCVYDIITKAANNANIKLKVTPHTLRHCFATHMLENGADLRSVQEMLGHADISTTQIYLNISNTKLKNEYYGKFKDPLQDNKKESN